MVSTGFFVSHLWDIFKIAYSNNVDEINKATLMFYCNCIAGSNQFKGAPELDWKKLCGKTNDTELTDIYNNDLVVIENMRDNKDFYKTITELFELGRKDHFNSVVNNFVA